MFAFLSEAMLEVREIFTNFPTPAIIFFAAISVITIALCGFVVVCETAFQWNRRGDNDRYPVICALSVAYFSFLFAFLIWPAGAYAGTISFPLPCKFLLGYLVITSIAFMIIYDRDSFTFPIYVGIRITTIHYVGALTLGLLMICFG